MLEALERRMGKHPFLVGRDADSLVARLDREGIERAWVLSEAYLAASDLWPLFEEAEKAAAARAENDFVAQQAARFPDRLVAFASVNPKRPSAPDEVDRCAQSLAMKGLKLHCWNSRLDVRDSGDRARLRAVLVRAAAHRMPVVVHALNGTVRDFGRQDIEIWARELIQPIAGLVVSFAHLGGAGGFAPPVQAVLEALVDVLGPTSAAAERVFLDLSAVLVAENTLGLPPTAPEERSRMGELLTAWGLDRVLWGSDSIPGYLDLSRQAWPLGPEAWSTICAAREVGRRARAATT